MTRHAHRRAGWHRRGSREGFAFSNGEYLGDVVDAARARPTKVDGLGPEAHTSGRPGLHVSESLTQELVDDRLEPPATRASKLFQRSRHVVIQGQGRPHASEHNVFDALVTTIGRSGQPHTRANRCDEILRPVQLSSGGVSADTPPAVTARPVAMGSTKLASVYGSSITQANAQWFSPVMRFWLWHTFRADEMPATRLACCTES